jgi:amicyanin
MRTLFLGTLLGMHVLLLAGCMGRPEGAGADDRKVDATAPTTPTAEATAAIRVVIDNFTFDPPQLTVPVGTKVTWTNRDDVPHTVTSSTRPRFLDSPTLDTDAAFSQVFMAPGTYDYYCTVHPKMTGQIIVK